MGFLDLPFAYYPNYLHQLLLLYVAYLHLVGLVQVIEN